MTVAIPMAIAVPVPRGLINPFRESRRVPQIFWAFDAVPQIFPPGRVNAWLYDDVAAMALDVDAWR